MKREIIKERGALVLDGSRLDIFVDFFARRFPDKSDEILSYVDEWADRFRYNPVRYMDDESKKIYWDIIKRRG